MTLLFAAVTSLCLGLLAVLALEIDAASGEQQLTSGVDERAGGLARAAYFDRGLLHLEPFDEDELAVGATFLAVYSIGAQGEVDGTAYSAFDHDHKLALRERDELVAEALREQGAMHASFTARSGDPMVWAAAPVWNDDLIGAVIIVGQETSTETAAHARLVTGLIAGCFTLLIAAAGAGYLLSGRAMRPAMRALSQQEQFLAEAAHELRTPLATLRLAVEAGGANQRARTLNTVDNLDHLITGLLTRARIESGTFDPERILLRLDQLAENVVHEFKDIDITFTGDPVVVVGDPVLLDQAIRNLIENARTHASGPVAVAVKSNTLTVSDRGPGIPEHRKKRALQRGVSTGGGTGTGLAIVVWVSQLHSASLALSDVPGGGLSVVLRFPPTPRPA